VLLDGAPAGRLTVERRAEEIHVLDIALLPEHRGRGLGSALLGELLDEGRRTGRPVTVNALRGGRALALYQRLGFALSGGDEVYADLTWRPPQLKTAS
jgi:GNAT superfamily N-acetyltransferase